MPNSENTKLIALIFSTKRSLMTYFKNKKKINPVIYIQAEILKFLYNNKASKMKDVSNYLGVTPPSATAMINKLVQEKYLIRQEDQNDRRQIILAVTQTGEKFMQTSFKNMLKAINETLNILSDQDKKDLVRIYNKLLKL